MKEKNTGYIVPIFMAVVFLIGFLATFGYGKYWDEDQEGDILTANIKEYVLQLMPEDSALYQSFLNKPEIRISESVEKDHGICAYYPIYPIMASDISVGSKSICWHVYTYLIFFAGILALYSIVSRLSHNRGIAMATVLLYNLSPRIFAQGHFNNKDIVLLSFLLCLIAIFLRLLDQSSWKWIFLAAFCAAITANTKVIGIAMLGAMGLMYLWISLAEKKSIKEIMKVIVGGLVLFILLYYLLTPAMWGHPVEFIQYLIVNAKEFQRWLGIIRFNGCNYNFTDNPLPARYLPYMICLTTPVYILILSLIGHLDLLGKLIKEKADFFRKRDNIICVILVCLWILPLGYAVLKRVHVYNGWRHFYFVYAPLIIMAGMGLNALWSYSEQRNKLRKSLTVIVSLCMLWSMAGMVKNHPYQYAYFNFLAGKDVSEKYDMDYWNISVQNALEYILNVSEGTVHIAACDYNTWVGLNFTKDTVKDADRIVTDETYTYWYETSWQSADYVIINVSYSHMYDNEAHSFIRENYENVYTISSYGNPIMEIYRRT